MKKIELLLGISDIILNTDDTDTTLFKIVSFLKKAVDADACSVYLLNQNKLVLSATEGLSEGYVGELKMDTDDGLTGLAFTDNKYTFIRNATKHEKFHYFQGLNEEPYNTFIGIPLNSRSHEFGVLVFQFKRNKRNTEILRKTLTAVAAQVTGLVLKFYLMQEDDSEIHIDGERIEKGVPLSSGIAFGEPVMVLSKLVEKTYHKYSPEEELESFQNALGNTQSDLKKLISDMEMSKQDIASGIFETHLMMINDRSFRSDIEQHITKKNKSAAFSVRHVADKYIKRFRSINDTYLQERASDVEDIAMRLLAHLGAVTKEANLLENSVVFADRLTPGETASLDLERVCSFVTEKDGVTSHTAILAKSRKIPAVTGIDNLQQKTESAKSIIVDGYEGVVIFNPEPETVVKYQDKAESLKLPEEAKELVCKDMYMPDGSKIEFLANVSSVLDSEKAKSFCADGIGLVRTEIFYLRKEGACSLEKRMETYRNILRAFPEKPVVFRLLDIGSDKKTAYEAVEDNPALGNRGVRLLLTEYRGMLENQLTALIKLSKENKNIKILVPFVADAEEFFAVKRIALEIAQAEEIELPEIGVMIEIPSIVYQMDRFQGECEFFSIGTNDMFQYFFALDRGNPKVSSLYSLNNPSFMELLKVILDKSKSIGIPVEICGEMAADPEILMELIKIGYRHFSVSPYAINDLKYYLKKAEVSI